MSLTRGTPIHHLIPRTCGLQLPSSCLCLLFSLSLSVHLSSLTQPSVNTRLKWLGLFHRDKHMPGGFMWRMRCPNGSYSLDQWKEILKVIRKNTQTHTHVFLEKHMFFRYCSTVQCWLDWFKVIPKQIQKQTHMRTHMHARSQWLLFA